MNQLFPKPPMSGWTNNPNFAKASPATSVVGESNETARAKVAQKSHRFLIVSSFFTSGNSRGVRATCKPGAIRKLFRNAYLQGSSAPSSRFAGVFPLHRGGVGSPRLPDRRRRPRPPRLPAPPVEAPLLRLPRAGTILRRWRDEGGSSRVVLDPTSLSWGDTYAHADLSHEESRPYRRRRRNLDRSAAEDPEFLFVGRCENRENSP